MKKILIIALVFVMVLSLSACGGGSSSEETADDAIVITMGHPEAEDTPIDQSFNKFKEYVEKESDGAIKVEVHANGELGSERQILEAINLGTIQLGVVTAANFEQYDDKFSILSLPFMFETKEQQEESINGDFGKEVLSWMDEYGFIGYGYQYDGARSISNNTRPINTVDDTKGLKIRVMESPVFVRMFELIGANPTPMSFTEVYTALSQGTVDGQDNPPGLTFNNNFYEVQKYYSLTQHVYSELPAIANKAWIEGLSADDRKIVEDGINEYLVKWQREYAGDLEESDIQNIRDSDKTTVNEISATDIKTFQDAVKPLYDEIKTKLGADLFDKTMALIK